MGRLPPHPSSFKLLENSWSYLSENIWHVKYCMVISRYSKESQRKLPHFLERESNSSNVCMHKRVQLKPWKTQSCLTAFNGCPNWTPMRVCWQNCPSLKVPNRCRIGYFDSGSMGRINPVNWEKFIRWYYIGMIGMKITFPSSAWQDLCV